MKKRIIKIIIVCLCTICAMLVDLIQEQGGINSIASAEDVITPTNVQAQEVAPSFSLYYCTKDEFISYCLEHHIRPDKIEYAWDLIRGQYTIDELAKKYCLEYDTIKRDRWKYKKKLKIDNKKLKC